MPNPRAHSKFQGVSWDLKKKKWYTRLTVDKKVLWGGRHLSEEDAAKAYDTLRLKNGKDALNFPAPIGKSYIPIPGFSDYLIRYTGEVYSIKNRERLALSIGNHGYRIVHLRKNGGHHTKLLHRLLAETFIGPQPSEDHEVAHKDGGKLNCDISNLRWATSRENKFDSMCLDRVPKGERHHNSKLTEWQVREIRSKYVPYKYTFRKLADEYRVSDEAISDIITRKRWRHVQ